MAKSKPSLARTPLFDLAVEQNARFTGFSGWEMPVQYTSIGQEHEAVRTDAGMFDISHMGKFAFTGKQLWQALQRLVPSDLSRLQPGQAQYTVLLNPQGGIIDDVIVYHQGEDTTGVPQAMIIVNAATCQKDKEWLLAQLENTAVKLLDLSQENVLIALQGPQAETYLQPFVQDDLTSLKSFEHLNATVLDQPGFIARTGYTG
ncbi:MAG: glycine cleavage system aminomethyltransferase GcvT, partial [Coleofasciculus sp. C2-GNP5-27]